MTDKNNNDRHDLRRVIVVTGLSGAGMTTALKALEDMGYKAFDNLPLALLAPLLTQQEGLQTPVAVGIDSRTWDFGADSLIDKVSAIADGGHSHIEIAFIDCADDVLQRRFTETKRLHPLAQDGPVGDGIARERRIMQKVRAMAHHVIDTSVMPPRDLRRLLRDRFALDAQSGLRITVQSFGFSNGLPRDADLVFDVRFLDNPYWDLSLRPLSGLDPAVGKTICADGSFDAFFENMTALLRPLLPRYDHEGKTYLTIAIGCTGGRHRSVFTAKQLYDFLVKEGYHAALLHRDMEDWARKHGIEEKRA